LYNEGKLMVAKKNKLVEKKKGNYPSRYKGMAPDLEMKEQKSSAYKSRYSSSLIPENESEMKQSASYKKRY